MNRKLIAALVAVFVLFSAAYIGLPFWAARQFRAAALSGDVDRLEAAVDFPAVRESLKGQLTTVLTAKMNDDPQMKSNPFAGLGMMLMPTIVARMIDSFVTPDGLAAMVRRGKVEAANAGSGAKVSADPNVEYAYDFRGLDRFAVTVVGRQTKEGEAPRFVFERRGLFSWKLIRLEIPDGVFADKKPTI